ncbi:MAG TPA: EamA family transporter [Lactobacillaceae bacterium]|jgi:chloramphenicol-sensitive protein RarD
MQTSKAGLAALLLSEITWGVAVLYWAFLHHLPPFAFLGLRVLLSLLAVVILLTATGGLRTWWRHLQDLLSNRRTLGIALLSALFLGANWLIYYVAVATNHATEAGLAYYIVPLINVLVGVFYFKDAAGRGTGLAFGLATIGVVLMAFDLRAVPVFALATAATFAVYGAIKRQLPPASVSSSLATEMLLLSPIALVALIGTPNWISTVDTPLMAGLVSVSGLITVVPMLLYTWSLPRVNYVLASFVFYLNPTLQVGLAVLFLGEHFSLLTGVALGFIWASVGVYLIGSLAMKRV